MNLALRSKPTRKLLALTAAWVFAALAISPVILHWSAPPASPFRTHIAIDISYLVAVCICWRIYHVESRPLGRRRGLALVFLVFLLSSFVNQVHHFDVDSASNYVASIPNEVFQEHLQESVTRLSPDAVPHAYRFLPNAIVFWMQLAGVRYDAARDSYRLLVGLLLFYALYRYASLYTNFVGAAIAMALVCAVYPISFEWYIGQLTDPLSHLSFVLAFLFLEAGDFAGLLTVLLIGSLAKETVLALAGFYAAFRREEKNYALKALVLCATSIAVYLAVRLLVLHGALHYGQVSGTHPSHIAENWRDTKWHSLFLITAGAYSPFLILGWRTTPLMLKRLVFYLVPILFVSSLLFGWLIETRNYMPVVFVLAVVTARFLAGPSTRKQCPPDSEQFKSTAASHLFAQALAYRGHGSSMGILVEAINRLPPHLLDALRLRFMMSYRSKPPRACGEQYKVDLETVMVEAASDLAR